MSDLNVPVTTDAVLSYQDHQKQAIVRNLSTLQKDDLLRMKKLLEVREKRLEFAVDHHLSSRAERMNFTKYLHVKDVYNSVSPNIVIMGAVQVLKSEWLLIDTLASADCGLSIFFVLPKYDSRDAYVQNRVDRCIQGVRLYKNKIKSGFFDNKSLKQFGSGVIKYVGSNVIDDFREFPGDCLAVEEVQDCDTINLQYGLDRLAHSVYKFTRYVGNPKRVNSDIHKKYLESDQRTRMVWCSECKTFNELDWFTCVVSRQLDNEGNISSYSLLDSTWTPTDSRDIKCYCPNCLLHGKKIEIDRYSLDAVWYPKNKDSNIEGYHYSMMTCSQNSLKYMHTTFEEGLTNPSILEQFYNSYLGIPHESVGTKINGDVLYTASKIDPYTFKIEGTISYVDNYVPATDQVTMGIDVGSNFDVRVSEIDEKNRRKAVYIGKVKSLESLYDIIRKFKVQVAVIDSGPEVRTAQEFQENCSMMGVACWLAKYSSEGDGKRLRKDFKNNWIFIDRTLAMDEVFSSYVKGKNLIPENYKDIHSGEYIKELNAPTRILDNIDRRNEKFVWKKCKDHSFHADVYDFLASTLIEGVTINEVYVA